MDLNELKSKHSVIKGICELVAEIHLELNDENAPGIFKVKIWKDSEGFFYPSPSHYLQRENDHDEYIPTYTHQPNIDKAVDEVFIGLSGAGKYGNSYHANEHF